MKASVLVIEDEELLSLTFKRFLLNEGYDALTAASYDGALALIAERSFDLIFADIILGGRTGIDVLREVKKTQPNCQVVMITGYPNVDTATEAIRLGAFDYIPKPVEQEKLLSAARRALKHKEIIEEKERYRRNLEAIFRSVKDGIITVDQNLSIIEINEAAMKLCGLTRGSVGRSFEACADDCNRRCCDALLRAIHEKRSTDLHRFQCERKNRPAHVVTLTASPLLGAQGAFLGAVIVLRDETRLSELERGLSARESFFGLIGKSEKMQHVYMLIEDLADMQTTVLITGESGTGKELVAEALHYAGNRRAKPLVKVNPGALSENLIESELFGHVRGAFTGANRDKIGRFEMASGGTIFLDEIGDISPGIQLKLLRVLQEKEIERVGGTKSIKVDARILAATNRDLRENVGNGSFRQDLYYRLKVVEVRLPALRERKEDIPLLVDHFLGKFSKEYSKEIVGVSGEVMERLMTHDWPGNVRELEHVLGHCCIVCRQPIITTEILASDFGAPTGAQGNDEPSSRPVSSVESDAILEALKDARWNKTLAARHLGISRRTLYRKMEEYKIN